MPQLSRRLREIETPDFANPVCHVIGMKKNLTIKLIDSLQPLHDRRFEVRDTTLPGFGIRVTCSGTKSWFVMGRIMDKQIRHTIGNYPIVSLAEAREAARPVLRDLQLGTYGQEVETPAPVTLADVVTDFVNLYAKPKNRSWKAQQATLQKFASLFKKPIAEIVRADIARVLDQIAASGAPTGANHALAVIKKLFA